MTIPIAISLPLLKLSEGEEEQVGRLRMKLAQFAAVNRIKSDYYEGKKKVEDLGISIPPQLRDVAVSVGWPGTVVDVLDELLTFVGWDDDGQKLGLDEVFRDNRLKVEASRAHLDALVYGTSFVSVGRGGAGEPEVLITAESTESCTAIWDHRARRVKAALSHTRDETGAVAMETLYLPDETVMFERVRGQLDVVNRDPHRLGRVPVVQFFNRDRASDVTGRSEITKPVIYYTDAALRTFLGMEVNREYYTSPQRYALGAEPETFGMSEDNSAEENTRAGWSAAMGRLNVVPMQEDANGDPVKPEMGQFNPTPPTPYIDQIKAYTQAISSETGIPASFLGFVTENPPSDGSIDNLKSRLNARAERRQDSFGLSWDDVGLISLMVRDGVKSVDRDTASSIAATWRPVTTPTRAAMADEATKLISTEVLSPDSSITWNRIGLSQQEQKQRRRELDAGRNRQTVVDLVAGLRSASAAAPADPQVDQLSDRTVAVPE